MCRKYCFWLLQHVLLPPDACVPRRQCHVDSGLCATSRNVWQLTSPCSGEKVERAFPRNFFPFGLIPSFPEDWLGCTFNIREYLFCRGVLFIKIARLLIFQLAVLSRNTKRKASTHLPKYGTNSYIWSVVLAFSSWLSTRKSFRIWAAVSHKDSLTMGNATFTWRQK